MNSLPLSIIARLIVPLQLAFSVILLLRGHNLPGGGFIGGLLAASAFALVGFADGPARMRALLRAAPSVWIGFGMLTALISGLAPVFAGESFFKGLWHYGIIPTIVAGDVKPGTPMLFDIGVYLLVVGIACHLVLLFEAKEAD